MIRRAGTLLLWGLLCIPGTTYAHHSVGANFDVSNIIEVEGEVTQISWQNPHVLFIVAVTTDSGETELWRIETNSVSILRRMDVSRDVLRVGERIRIAGNPARRRGNQLFARNMLLPDTQEVLLSPGSALRWEGETIGTSETWLAEVGDTSDPESGIFRVWSTSLSGGNGFWNEGYPLTATARAALEAFDPVDDSPILDCAPKGMPSIMSQPYPMEFVAQDQVILLRVEEYDIVRRIPLDAEPGRDQPPPTDLGYSIGHWEGPTLVVTTTGISWPYFSHNDGIPQSEAAQIEERFTPSPDGSRLDLTMTIRDAANFTEPVVLDKQWLWLPDVQVEPYECTVPG